jgi:hypothetical protein
VQVVLPLKAGAQVAAPQFSQRLQQLAAELVVAVLQTLMA